VRKKLWVGLGILALVMSGVVFGVVWNKTPLSSAGLNLDMAAPDALIRSKSLSRLPADLLRVPLLHDLLTEEFLFYYENSEGRLGLSGTLRRIAYEHDVTLTDELIKLVLDEPAEVAMWRASNGTLKYYAIAMTRSKLAKILEPAAKIALKDKQLTMVGEAKVGGDAVQLFALEYAWNRKFLVASHSDRVVVFSDPGMVLDSNGDLNPKANILLDDLLGSDKIKQQRFAKAFDLDDSSSDHSIAIKAGYLSFAYQHFFPSLKALRFEFSEKPLIGEQTWSTAALLDSDPAHAPTLFNAHDLWSSLPYQPSACVAMPVDWHVLTKAMNSQEVINLPAEQFALQFNGPAVGCWYAKSRLHSPLFVAQLSKEEGADAMLAAYFNYGIKEAGSQESKRKNPIKATSNKAGDVIWQNAPSDKFPQITLARVGKLIYFSPDAALVEQAIAVAHKRQPALSDSWSDLKSAANVVAVIGPGQLAQLAEHEVEISLPQQDEVLNRASEQYLLPQLAAVKKFSPMRLEMHDTPKGAGWVTLDWKQY
jgi:uncharacterized protein YfaA (DUF2138 family)